MKLFKSKNCYFKIIALFILVFTFYSCNTTHKKTMDHFIKGKIILIDTSSNNNDRFNFVMQLDSSNKNAMVIASKELMSSPKLQQLKKGQYVKVKGDKIIYIDHGKENKHAANTYIINELQILEQRKKKR